MVGTIGDQDVDASPVNALLLEEGRRVLPISSLRRPRDGAEAIDRGAERKEETIMRKFITVIAAVTLLSACAQRPLTTQEKGAVTGAALGAGTGALIGSATGKAGTGAAIGAGVGLLTGALIGGAMENQQGEAAPPPPGPPAGTAYPAQQQAAIPSQTAGTVDPTAGQFLNNTRWRLEVFVDAQPQSLQAAPRILLNPQESRPHSLDLGPHRVIARAIVDTQFGTRTVGQYDRTIQVDPRGSGWTLRFTEADFR